MISSEEFNSSVQRFEGEFLAELQNALRQGGINKDEVEFAKVQFQDDMKGAIGWARERVTADF